MMGRRGLRQKRPTLVCLLEAMAETNVRTKRVTTKKKDTMGEKKEVEDEVEDESDEELCEEIEFSERSWVVIELRNDTTIEGYLSYIDPAMSSVLVAHATSTRPNGEKEEQEELYVNGRNIRYIQLPEHLDARKLLQQQGNRIERAKQKYKRGVRKAPVAKPPKPESIVFDEVTLPLSTQEEIEELKRSKAAAQAPELRD